MEDELTSLEGMKVSVPYSTEYSGTSYHNAVIFAVVSTEYEVQPIISIIAFLRRRYFVAFLRQDKIFSILVLDCFRNNAYSTKCKYHHCKGGNEMFFFMLR